MYLPFFLFQTFLLYHNGRPVNPASDAPLPRDSTVEVVPSGGLPGGKGGFGSMLRSIGAQIEKTTNRDACRDLTGRRLRDIKEEEELKKYVSKQAERERVAKEAKEAKLNKLRRLANGENKHEFHDPKFEAEREAATDRVHDAMEQAFKSQKEKKPAAAAATATSSSSGVSSEEDDPKPSTSGVKRKSPAAPERGTKKGLWLGMDLNDSDLESSSDDEEEEVPAKKKK